MARSSSDGGPPAHGGDPGPAILLAPEGMVGMLDVLSDGIAVMARDGTIRYANHTAARNMGRPPSEYVGRNIWEEFPEAVGGPYHQAFDEAWRTGEPQRVHEYFEPFSAWYENRLYPQGEELLTIFRDITDERRTGDELSEYVQRIAEAERIVGFGIWEWDVARGRVTWSDELHRIYGLRPGEFEGTVEAFVARVHPDDRDRVWSHVSEALEKLQPFAFEERILRADGEERRLISKGRVIPGPDGSARAMVGVCHDVTDRSRAEQQLDATQRRMQAIVDNTPSMITVKDLEGRYLMGNAEAEHIVGMSAAEFTGKLCRDLFPPEIAAEQRVNDQLAASEGEAVYGEATLPRDGEDRTYVTVTFPLRDEDSVAVETCTIATDVTERKERESERRERVEWTEEISTAASDDRLLVYGQPVVDLETGDRAANEMLVRMRSRGARAELLEPAAFLPAAERYELVPQIDLWMVRQALAMPLATRPHVNLSAVTLCDPDARLGIIELLAAAPAAAGNIVFEITETASVVRLQAAREFAAAATELGCRLALDDFGVGFGSFTYLRSLPLSYIKIDISFVRGLRDSADDRRVVEGIIGIAREFGMETIAEGIEDEETRQLLRSLGADFGQGYHLGTPAPLAG